MFFIIVYGCENFCRCDLRLKKKFCFDLCVYKNFIEKRMKFIVLILVMCIFRLFLIKKNIYLERVFVCFVILEYNSMKILFYCCKVGVMLLLMYFLKLYFVYSVKFDD